MFINSSSTFQSKILQTAIEIDESYKKYIQSREKIVSPFSETSCSIIKT
jgi:hypothetical protein